LSTNDLGDFLDREVYPALFDRLDSAFPEYRFRRKGNRWEATADATRSLPDKPRPARVNCYVNRPWGLVTQGGEFVRFLDLGVDLVPSSAWLVGAERALAGEVGAETILRRKLKAVAGHYDVALVDTPPTLGVLTVGALVAADLVLVPVEAHVMALNGLAQLLNTVERVRDRLNENLELLGIAACRVDARTRHAPEVVEELRKRFPKETFRTVIRENVRLAEAPSFGQAITDYETESAGAEDYRALAGEVLGRLAKRK
jgi:cellulose biosynthesis protein BcsQ